MNFISAVIKLWELNHHHHDGIITIIKYEKLQRLATLKCIQFERLELESLTFKYACACQLEGDKNYPCPKF